MSRVDDLIKNLNAEAFAVEFLKRYLRDGFGKMQKTHVDLKVFSLLTKCHSGWSADPSGATYDMSLALGIPQQKVRRMLDELDFLDEGRNEEWCAQRLKQELTQGEVLPDGNKVQVQIEEGIVRQYARKLVREKFGVVDRSFDRTIIVLSAAQFTGLCVELLPGDERKRVEKELKKLLPAGGGANKPITRLFFEGVASGAGKQVGSSVVRVGMALLTGGATEVVEATGAVRDALKTIKSFFEGKQAKAEASQGGSGDSEEVDDG